MKGSEDAARGDAKNKREEGEVGGSKEEKVDIRGDLHMESGNPNSPS